MADPLVILTGPTAVGKTDLSLKLARAIGGEIISADSMQVYRGMDIGSAKIRPEEMQGIPHYLIDELDPTEPFHVVRFQELAEKYRSQICARGHIPILTGGTGFYIQAVLYGIDFTEQQEDPQYRARLEQLARDRSGAELHRMLEQVDPESAGIIHENNIRRMIRALEFYHLSGQKISDHNAREHERISPYRFAYFVLSDDRQAIYERCDRRVDKMMEDGLLDEVRRLKAEGCTADMTSMKGIGYSELLDYLDGNCSLEEAVNRIKLDTRHFAKRQLTWFRREKDVIWIRRDSYGGDEDAMLADMIKILKERGVLEEGEQPDPVRDKDTSI